MWRQREARVLKQEAELGHAIAKLTRAQKVGPLNVLQYATQRANSFGFCMHVLKQAMVSELTCMNCLEIFNKPVS